MASHVPFLAVRPDEQFSHDLRSRDVHSDGVIESTAAADSPPLIGRAPRHRAVSRVPRYIRFPLLVVVSLGLNTILRSLTAEVSGLQFAPASRDPSHRPELIGFLLASKVAELAAVWAAGFDYEDLAALTLLTNQPYYYLLYSFWSVEIVPILVALSIDIAAIAVPFALLRPLSPAHDAHHARTANQRLAHDWQIILLTATLAASVYAVTFSLFYYFELGVFLITHFAAIPSLETAHESNLPKMVALFAASGFGAMLFLFRPTMAAAGKPSLVEKQAKGRKAWRFNAETATLGETIAHNLGIDRQLSHRAEVLIKRAVVLVACTMANTFVRIFGTIEGTDVVGSLGYAGLWAAAHTLVIIVYAWLGNEQ